MKTVHELPTLETERLLLREMSLDDAEAVFAYASDPEMTRYVPWETHVSLEDSREFLRSVVDGYEKLEVFSWGMTLRESDGLIGTIGLHPAPEHDRAEAGYVLSRAYWRTGLTTEALREVVRFGFEALDLARIEARCFAENIASARVMEKVGMVYEGTLRKRELIKGVRRDVKYYSILRSG